MMETCTTTISNPKLRKISWKVIWRKSGHPPSSPSGYHLLRLTFISVGAFSLRPIIDFSSSVHPSIDWASSSTIIFLEYYLHRPWSSYTSIHEVQRDQARIASYLLSDFRLDLLDLPVNQRDLNRRPTIPLPSSKLQVKKAPCSAPTRISMADQFVQDEAGGSRIKKLPRSTLNIMRVANNKVDLVIGKGGETIKNIRAMTGARVQVIPMRGEDETYLLIEGTLEQIDATERMVNDVTSDEAASEESAPSVFQHCRNLPTDQHFGTQEPNENTENAEEQTGGYTSSKEKKNLTWDDDMDNFLIDLLIDQMHLGQKIGNTFTKSAFCKVAESIKSKFSILCSAENIKNRIKTLKKNQAMASAIMGTSGFTFNETTQMVEADVNVWNKYLSVHPEAKYYRSRPIQNFRKLHNLFSKDRATESLAVGPKERQMHLEAQQEEATPNEDLANNEATSSFAGALGSKSAKKRKFKDYVSDELKEIIHAIDGVAVALDRVNESELFSKLFSELSKMEGLKEVALMQIYIEASSNVRLARSFLAVPPERRAMWLRVKYNEYIFDAT